MLPTLKSFRWGQAPERTAEIFANAGWKRKIKIEDQLQLVVPIDEETKAAIEESFSGELPESYTMTLFSQNGRLLIVKIYKRDQTKTLRTWLKDIKKSLMLDNRIWKSGPRTNKLPAGVTVTDTSEVYDTGDLFVVVHTSQSEISGELQAEGKRLRLEDGANMEAELRLYHKQENQGLTGEALIQELGKETK